MMKNSKKIEDLAEKSYKQCLDNGSWEHFFHYTDEKIYGAGFYDGYIKCLEEFQGKYFSIIGVVAENEDDFVNYVLNSNDGIEYPTMNRYYGKSVITTMSNVYFFVYDKDDLYGVQLTGYNIVYTERSKLNPNYDEIVSLLKTGLC